MHHFTIILLKITGRRKLWHGFDSSLRLRTSVLPTYVDLVPPVPSVASGDELSPSDTIAGSISRVTPVYTRRLQIFFQCISPCPHWSSNPPSAAFWDPLQSQTSWSGCRVSQQIVFFWSLLCRAVPIVQIVPSLHHLLCGHSSTHTWVCMKEMPNKKYFRVWPI